MFADNQITIPVNISCFLGLFFLNLFIFLFSECQSKALYNFLHALFVEAYDQIAKESLKKHFYFTFFFFIGSGNTIMIQVRSTGKWVLPETIEGLAKLKQDYLDATAAVDGVFTSLTKAAEGIHVDKRMLKR